MIACPPPWPVTGVVGWAASPSSATRVEPQEVTGARSYTSLRRIAPASVRSTRSATGGNARPNLPSTKPLRPPASAVASAGWRTVATQYTRPSRMCHIPKLRPAPRICRAVPTRNRSSAKRAIPRYAVQPE